MALPNGLSNDAQWNALPDSIKNLLIAAQAQVAQIAAPAAAPARQAIDTQALVQAIGEGLEYVFGTGQPFSAQTVVSAARRAHPDWEIPGFDSREIVRATLLSDDEADSRNIPVGVELVRKFVLDTLSPAVQATIKMGNIFATPNVVIKGNTTTVYQALAYLAPRNTGPATSVQTLVDDDDDLDTVQG